jgi:excisionase family DNA binding protein
MGMESAGPVPPADASRRLAPRSVLVDQAAELLGVSRRTIYNRIREGRLQTIRTRCGSQRVLLESVESLLREMVKQEQERTRGRDAGV